MTAPCSDCHNSKEPPTLTDDFQRKIDYVRLAVTADCNLRCSYCMREEHEEHTSRADQLSTEEIHTIINVLAEQGITKLRLTGGEPLLQHDIVEIVRRAKQQPNIQTVNLTTNGLLLDKLLAKLIDAGLDSINVSIDTLRRDRYKTITRRDEFERAKSNFTMLLESNMVPVKLNVVVIKRINSDELEDFVALTRDYPLIVRFIELQPFDDNQIWRTGQFFGADKIQEMLTTLYPEMQILKSSATQNFTFSLPNHQGQVAIIPAYTRNFCHDCNKIRITSTGKIISCLYGKEGIELLPLLRSGASNEAIAALFRKAVALKPENGKHAASNGVRTSMSEIGG